MITALLTAAFCLTAPAPRAEAAPQPQAQARPAFPVDKIANIARSQLTVNGGGPGTACSPGYNTSCTGNGHRGEYWCADFASWVWGQAGFHTQGLNAAARSFQQVASKYGGEKFTPTLGDAVLFHDTSGGQRGVVHHVALVVGVSGSQITIVSGDVGGEENTKGPEGDEQAHYAHTSKVRLDTLNSSSGTAFGNSEALDGYVNAIPNNVPLGAPDVGDGSTSKSWVKTFASAPGRDHGGRLNAGRNYVFCKAWGAQVGTGSSYNHWWLYTDMDTGGQDFTSAYYLSGQGNDSAQDENGEDLPTCDGTTSGSGRSGGRYWVRTFQAAGGLDNGGTLNAGRNYVFCKVWGAQVGSGSSYNHWWLYTDMDTGGKDYVSAYYLSGQGNDVALDETGTPVPECGAGDDSGGKSWVDTFQSATGRDHNGTLYTGRNYVFCKVWGAQVGTGSSYNHWWLYTDMDTGGKDYVSAYYLSGQGNDVARDVNGNDIHTC
ncbi:CHAP domain-containing protein [Streptomyces sp. RKAG337]|uniref:CHAP domain-containing protein n=1 Tax=Streptomyces sp. RKAG337 TaxID=2893404 RepID=UPI0035A86B84